MNKLLVTICVIFFLAVPEITLSQLNKTHYEKLKESLDYQKYKSEKSLKSTPKSETGPFNIKHEKRSEIRRELYEEYVYDFEDFVEVEDYETSDRESYRENLERKREYLEKIKEKQEKETRKNKPEENVSQPKRTVNSAFMNILAILIVLVIILLIVYFMYKNKQPIKKVTGFDENKAPADIPKTELELALEKAIQNKNYREAVRIYFVFIIKDLSEKNWIKWKKNKTNFSYLSEMTGRDEYHGFYQVVTLYEIIWYGVFYNK